MADPAAFRALNPEAVVQTLRKLEARIAERFPGSGLAQVCADLTQTGALTAARARALSRPYFLLRAGVALIIAAGAALVGWYALAIHWETIKIQLDAASIAQGLQSAAGLVILMGSGIWALATQEQRVKQRRVLRALYELRSFAHVIDMHQLTKDPTVILAAAKPTASSPKRPMSRFELARYLDYCTEMLSLTGKLAAIYAEFSHDATIVQAVNEIEQLTTDLGRKIWQKITILADLEERAAHG